MNGILKNKLAACVLVLIVISVGYVFALDVTVQQGDLIVDDDLLVADELKIGAPDDPSLFFDYSFGYANLILDSDYGNELSLYVDDYAAWFDTYAVILCDTFGAFYGQYLGYLAADLEVEGKITSYGGYDPPYVLYDQQSREEVIDRIKKEVPPDKQGGAAMFFNKETKRLETYVASEGKFYDLEGNLIHELAEVVKPATKYETVYHFDSTTGQARPILRPVQEKFQIKEGYALNDKTGNFINKKTKQVVSREEALEIFAASEGKIYDLQHNFVRNIEKKQSPDIAAAGNNTDSSTRINIADNSAEKQEITVKPAYLNK